MLKCYLSNYQVLRLISLIDGAISVNQGCIDAHNDFLSSLSEDELSNLDDFELNYSSCLDKDVLFLSELKLKLKLCSERGKEVRNDS